MHDLTTLRFSVTFATVQMQPSELTEADLRAPAGEFARLTHANDRAREGKLWMHKAEATEEHRDGETCKGLFQSAMFDTDRSNGRDELRDLLDAVKTTVLERFYPVEERRVIGG